MDIFGIGLPELIVIILLALIFLGPDELPKLARQSAKLIAQVKQITDEVNDEIKKETVELNKALPAEYKEAQQALQETAATINNLQHLPKSMLKQLDPTKTPTPPKTARPTVQKPVEQVAPETAADLESAEQEQPLVTSTKPDEEVSQD